MVDCVSVEKENGRGFFLPRGITPFRISDNVLLHKPFTLCRACVDSPTYAAQRYLTLCIGREMGRHIGLPLRNGNPTAVPLFHAYAVYHLHPSPCGKRGDSQEGGKPQVVYPLVRPPRAAATFPHAAACEILCRGYGKPLHRRSAVPLSFQGRLPVGANGS